MGIGSGAVTEGNEAAVTAKGIPSRRWKKFPRNLDQSLNVPRIAAKIDVCNCTEDLQLINQSSSLSAYGCSICPGDDRLISAVTVMKRQLFHEGQMGHLALSNNVPTAGFVSLWLVKQGREVTDGPYIFEDCSPILFTYSPQPRCRFSPDGNISTIILNSGKESLTLMKRDEDDNENDDKVLDDIDDDENGGTDGADDANCEEDDIWFSEFSYTPVGQKRTTLCGRVMCIICSPCGTKMASISKVSLSTYRDREIHEVCMWDLVADGKIRSLWSVSCEVIDPQFSGVVSNCKFSPDSNLIGICSNQGYCIFVLQNSGEHYSSIEPNENNNPFRYPCDIDFHPLYDNTVAIVWRSGCLKIFKLTKDDTFCCFSFNEHGDQLLSDCVKYSADSSFLSVGTIDGKIIVLGCCDGKMLHCLDASYEISNLSDRIVFDICFTKSCEEVAAAYADGYIRIWQLPRILNLQHICRLAILSTTSMCRANELPLPEILKLYLLYK